MSDLASPRNSSEISHLITCTEQSQMIKCKHDPVQRLPPETITDIICYLEAEDTEKLRRLSKSWKSASETSNTKQAILQHPPRPSCPLLTTGLQYNLFFRRLLYHNSSLKRGRVTKSHYFSDVYRWSLRSNRLVLMSKDNELRIYDLASDSDNKLEAEHCMLKTKQKDIKKSDVLECVMSLNSHGGIVVRRRTRLFGIITSKISTDLTRQWSVAAHWDVSAAGTEHVYGLVFTDGPENIKSRLVTQSFNTEAETSDILIDGSFPREVKKLFMLEATITSDEQFFILRKNTGILRIIDVLSGKMTPITGAELSEHVRNTSIFLHPESPDFRVSVFEQILRRFRSYEYAYDVKLAAYNVSLISTVDFSEENYTASVGLAFDLPNHLLVLRRGQTAVEHHEGKWKFLIRKPSPWKGYWDMTIPSDEGRADLLLPIRDNLEEWYALGRRQDYFGMVDGYLVYHHAIHQRLMVADFWPSW